MATPIGTITFTGSVVADQITTSPWPIYGAVLPEYGAVPYMPVFEVDVLQPINVDGARYRLAGSHFPAFRLLTVCPAADFSSASTIAREHEMCVGDMIYLDINNDSNTPRTCVVIKCKATPNAKRIIGAKSSAFIGGSSQVDSMASVDTEWFLQVIAQ